MKQRRSPQEKKALAYDRDHVSRGWSSGATFRKHWRKKEQSAERAYRRASHVAAHALAATEDPEGLDTEGRVRRRRLKKSAPPSLREVVAHKLERRRGSVGVKRRRKPERARWTVRSWERYLSDLLRNKRVGRVQRLRDLPAFVVAEAQGRVQDPEGLATFLRRNPVWLVRLRAWRRSLLERRRLVEKRGRRTTPRQ
jgi:hypothetical protein